jgi:hypothetical protein
MMITALLKSRTSGCKNLTWLLCIASGGPFQLNFRLSAYLLFVLRQWHRTAIDARPQRPVLESGHSSESIFVFCALAFEWLTLGRAHSFCSSVHSFGLHMLRGVESLAEDFLTNRMRTASRSPLF